MRTASACSPNSRFLVVANTGDDSGDYRFRVLDLETFATPLAFDTIESGTLPTGRDTAVFSFDAAADESLNFNGLSRDSMFVRVFDAHLQSVYPASAFDASPTADGPFAISRSGLHYVVLQGNQDTPADFSFQIQDLNLAPFVNLGDVISGVISLGRTQQHFHINLTAGQKLFVGETGILSATFFNPHEAQFTYDRVFFGRLNQAPQITSLPPVEAIIDRTSTYDVDATDLRETTSSSHCRSRRRA